MSDDTSEQGQYSSGPETTARFFFDDDSAASAPAEVEPQRLGFWRHLGSLVLGLVLTPVALVLIDYGLVRRQLVGVQTSSGDVDARALLALIGAGLVLFVVAALARLSPLGPLVAGIGWGLVPWVLVTFFLERVYSWLDRLPNLYDDIGVNAPYYGFGLYAAVAALLVGTGYAASWRRRARP